MEMIKLKLVELLDMPLREILENYCVLFSEECCWTYGVTTHDAFREIEQKYDMVDEPSMVAEPILFNVDLLMEFEDDDNPTEILTVEKIEEIIDNNLMIEKKIDGGLDE